MRLTALALGLALVACDEPAATPDAGVDAGLDAQSGQGSEATSDLVVNEVMPRGVPDDWIELHNRGTTAIDLCGYFLTDVADRLDHYLPLGGVMPPATCPPRMLEPGQYLVIAIDGTPLPTSGDFDPTHAPFSLAVADQVQLLTIDGANVDGVTFLYPRAPGQPADVALARVPNGSGLFFAVAPSRGAINPAVVP